jgi:uncharacterized coiled-coil DUF342 family protein
MKLAEALTLRADLQKRIQQIHSRLLNNAKVQEGEEPAEDPKELMKELEDLTVQLEDLITRINVTNVGTKVKEETLTSMLAKRDCLSKQNDILRDFLESASSLVMRGTQSEIKVKSSVSVRELQKEVDRKSKQLRELDVRIQGLNWTTDLK